MNSHFTSGFSSGSFREWIPRILLPLLSGLLALLVIELGSHLFSFGSEESPEYMFWQHDPDLGWSHKPGDEGIFASKLHGFRSHVALDEFGVRKNQDGVAGPFDHTILVVGDSVTAGFEVEGDQTFSAVLEKKFQAAGQRVRVVNAGVRGYGTDQAYLMMKRLLPVFHPDLVLYVYCWNDLGDNITVKNRYRVFGKPVFVLEDQGTLREVNHPVAPMAPGHFDFVYNDHGEKHVSGEVPTGGIRVWLRTHTKIYGSLEDSFFEYVLRPPPRPKNEGIPPAYNLALFRALVAKMKSEAPRLVLTSFVSSKRTPHDQVEEAAEAARAAGADFVDLRPSFPEARDFIFPVDGHWNASGHAAAAQGLFSYFEKLPWLRATKAAARLQPGT